MFTRRPKIEPGQIVTFSGRTINPLDPDPDDISIDDIAHALANACRFTGHTKVPYSVAQHSYLVHTKVPDEDKLWACLHDAPEAYLGDLAAPIKNSKSPLAEAYLRAEEVLMEAVCEHFNLPLSMPESVKEADQLLLRSEIRDFMPAFMSAAYEGNKLGFTIKPWDAETAERELYWTVWGLK
jgi:hypothetical protein